MARKKNGNTETPPGLLGDEATVKPIDAQPEAQIKPMTGGQSSQYVRERGEPRPERAPEGRVGLYVFQQHGGGRKPCRGFNTVAVTTKTEKMGDSKAITRYRRCLTCNKRYSHVTILKKMADGFWAETGTGFDSD